MANKKRLSAEELEAWRLNLLSWQLIDRQLERQLQRDAGMPHAYYAILVALNEQGNRSLPLTRLADALEYSQSRMSHAVSKLEESGWVERVADDADRRVSALRLTDDGVRAYSRASAGHLDQVRTVFFDQLDETDLTDLRRIGKKLLDGLTQDQPHTRAFGRVPGSPRT